MPNLSMAAPWVALLVALLAGPGQAADPAPATRRQAPPPKQVDGPAARSPMTAAELKAVDESPALQRIRAQQRLIVAFSKTGSPFSVADTDGSAKGFAIDVCTRIAIAVQKQLKLPDLRIDYVSPPFAERLQAVREGKADLECGNTISNAERRQTLAFTLPIYLTASRLLVRKDAPISNLSSLRGRTVVTTAGASAERVFRGINQKFSVGAQLATRPTAAEAFAALAKGEADALFMSDIVLSDLLARAPDPGQFAMLRDAYSVDSIAVVLGRDDPGLKILADRELRRMMADGEMHKLYARWFQSPIPPAGANLNLRLNELTREHYKRPSDDVNQNLVF